MVKAVVEDNKDLTKDLLHTPKEGFIQKKKNQKFKQTPTGKVPLINGSKTGNNDEKQQQQQLEKQKTTSSKKSLENKKEQKTANSPKNKKKLHETSKKNEAQSEEDDSDSDEDINEGIVLEYSSMQESGGSNAENSDEDESEDEKSPPNILGTSLADDSDEDDEDYEEDEEATQVNKGVKMFKGSKSKDRNAVTSKDSINKSKMENDDDKVDEKSEENFEVDSSDEEDNEDEVDDEQADDSEEESEDVEEGQESMLSWEAILSNSIIEDDEDDEDFNELEEIDDDEDDEISDEDEEDEDDDEDDEDDEEGNNDRTISHEQSKKHKENFNSSLEKLKEDKRTIFIGNLPKEGTKKQLRKQFKKFGNIDTIRLRGIIGKSMNMPKKVAAIKKDIHPRLKSVFAYIKYKSEESANAALSMNGKVFGGNYLRVDLASKSNEKLDVKKSVFIGNLPFNIDENTIRKHFKGCGEVESVRIIRDKKTRIGKGFGYVNFKTEDAVALALELHGTTILNRELRVKPCSEQTKKGRTKHRKRSHSSEGEKNSVRKLKNNKEVSIAIHNKKNATKKLSDKGQKFDEKQISPQQSKAFQGRKADEKKKKKTNKVEKKKKVLAEKLAAKPKKPSN